MLHKSLWILFGLLCVAIGLYPVLYFIGDHVFGLLNTKSEALLANAVWNTGFYTHIGFGGLALLIGWTQFSVHLRQRYAILHRRLGKVYVGSVFLSALAGFGISFYATGGWVSASGFICLAVIWFYSTFKAYRYISQGRVVAHQKMMIFSYAACFAAVTLRIYLPLLILATGEFEPAYKIVAWLCWMPNILIANLLAKRIK